MDTPSVELEPQSRRETARSQAAWRPKKAVGRRHEEVFCRVCTRPPKTKPLAAIPTTPSIHDDASTTT
eukprot:8503528-Pyramimonas_sp.AAC.1